MSTSQEQNMNAVAPSPTPSRLDRQETPVNLDRFEGGSLSVQNITMSFGPLKVLHGVSFDVAQGEVVCIIGPSGSGKSTALRCINRLEQPTGGGILVGGGGTRASS